MGYLFFGRHVEGDAEAEGAAAPLLALAQHAPPVHDDDLLGQRQAQARAPALAEQLRPHGAVGREHALHVHLGEPGALRVQVRERGGGVRESEEGEGRGKTTTDEEVNRGYM